MDGKEEDMKEDKKEDTYEDMNAALGSQKPVGVDHVRGLREKLRTMELCPIESPPLVAGREIAGIGREHCGRYDSGAD